MGFLTSRLFMNIVSVADVIWRPIMTFIGVTMWSCHGLFQQIMSALAHEESNEIFVTFIIDDGAVTFYLDPFNAVLPGKPLVCLLFFSIQHFVYCIVCMCHASYLCCMSWLSVSIRFVRPNNILWRIEIMQLRPMHLSPASCFISSPEAKGYSCRYLTSPYAPAHTRIDFVFCFMYGRFICRSYFLKFICM
jgi:hypothetical protein